MRTCGTLILLAHIKKQTRPKLRKKKGNSILKVFVAFPFTFLGLEPNQVAAVERGQCIETQVAQTSLLHLLGPGVLHLLRLRKYKPSSYIYITSKILSLYMFTIMYNMDPLMLFYNL